MPDIPPEAIAAAFAAYQRAWVTRNHSNPLFAENVVRDVLEAAAPLLAAQCAAEATTAPRYPQHAACAACGRPVLVTMGRDIPLMFDPEPDGEGDHFDTVMTANLSRVSGSGDATAVDCKGRFPLYRAHAWTCPRRLEAPGGQWGIWVPRHVEEEP